MPWVVINHEEFDAEFDALPQPVRVELLAATGLLEIYGPTLGRPHADTLTGSKHANMKELRFNADNGVWRVAFAFDPARQAIILPGRRRQERSGAEAVLQGTDRQGGQPVRRASQKN